MCFGVSSSSSPRSKPSGRSRRNDSCAVNATSCASTVEDHSRTDLLHNNSISRDEFSIDVSLKHMVKESTGKSSVDSSAAEESSGNKIMVVVDSSLEAKGALEWALSHTAQTHDTILLLHLANGTLLSDRSPATEIDQSLFVYIFCDRSMLY